MKTIQDWINEYPLINELVALKELFWSNPKKEDFKTGLKKLPLNGNDVKDAEERLKRFAPYIAKVFPETSKLGGIIESPLVLIQAMREKRSDMYGTPLEGRFLLKCDSHLPISGSI